MDEEQRIPVAITRHPGKPTSGRFVYHYSTDVVNADGLRVEKGAWYWQCDLHGDDSQWVYGDADTWESALRLALAHADTCPFVAMPSSRHNDR